MVKLRLRTKFLFSLIFTTAALTTTSLLIVQSYAGKHARQDIDEQVENATLTFQQFALQRQTMLAQSAEIAASQPNIKALITTQHGPTIQEASSDLPEIAGAGPCLPRNPHRKELGLSTAKKVERATPPTALDRHPNRRQSNQA